MSLRWFVIALVVVLPRSTARADLGGYVTKSDPAFQWSLKEKTATPLGTVYDLHLVSQVWHDITWEHGLQIYVPAGVEPMATVFLWNQGGKPGAESTAFGLSLATKMKAPVAFLFGIPNQPLFGDLKEDALIAETFVRYLESEDGSWPLLFPMVKSLVRAMDAIQAFADKEWQKKVTGFVVSGASKRGWTTWLTAASDPRVKAIAPLVIDTLNIPEQLPLQLKSFGTYSEMIGDYTRRGLVPLPDTTAARSLWRMVDPYVYRDRYTMPKMIINGANDRYWVVDALNNYWDGLPANKSLLYVPNAGHSLSQQIAEGKKDRSMAIDALAAFGGAQIHGRAWPSLSWKHDDDAGQQRLVAQASQAPKSARLWVADAPTRDFRPIKWNEQPAEVGADGKVAVRVAMPKEGYRAFFLDLSFDDGQPFHLSTQIRVSEAKQQ